MTTATPHAISLVKMINRYNLSVIAEVGVWKGHTARYILRAMPRTLTRYWGIDQYDLMDDRHGHMHKRVKKDWDKLYFRMCLDMQWFPRFRMVRFPSVEASKLFKLGYFDLVFIDASHFYEDVKEDVIAWLPKIKRGGFLLGHDYGTRKHPEVKQFVDDYFKGKKILFYPGSIWGYRVP